MKLIGNTKLKTGFIIYTETPFRMGVITSPLDFASELCVLGTTEMCLLPS